MQSLIFVTVVLDGVGIGAAADANDYGDEGADTLGHVCEAAGPRLPNLSSLGLGLIRPLAGVAGAAEPRGSFGSMRPRAAGKDSTTGHWELAGLVLERPFPTYPNGFPTELLALFCAEAGLDGVLGNRPASGTTIIDELGNEHVRTGKPIVYTSGDSVFQVAAHTRVFGLDRLYDACRIARERVCVGAHAVGRVIARPFEGDGAGRYRRISAARRDYSLPPPGPTVLDALREAGVRTVAVGKVAALFAGAGVEEEIKTAGNADGVRRTVDAVERAAASGRPTFIWTNLVDFDELYGHRNDAAGFAAALEAFDEALPVITGAIPNGGRLLITADHGNDPCFPGSDHTRESVPLLLYEPGRPARHLNDRVGFADHAASVAHHFGVGWHGAGTSFLDSTA